MIFCQHSVHLSGWTLGFRGISVLAFNRREDLSRYYLQRKKDSRIQSVLVSSATRNIMAWRSPGSIKSVYQAVATRAPGRWLRQGADWYFQGLEDSVGRI